MKLIKIPMPEGGAEADYLWPTAHNCELAEAMRKEFDDEDLDILVWAVGLFGHDLGVNIPFEVWTTNDCGVCGRGPFRAMFMWTGPKIYVP